MGKAEDCVSSRTDFIHFICYMLSLPVVDSDHFAKKRKKQTKKKKLSSLFFLIIYNKGITTASDAFKTYSQKFSSKNYVKTKKKKERKKK